MKNKALMLSLALMMSVSFATPSYAIGAKEAGASLLLPSMGQAMNGELGTTKSKVMAGLEIAGLTTVAILGGVVGGGVVWAGLGPMIANRIWSATDAYQTAQKKVDPMAYQQMMEAQKTLELSRQRRFERQEAVQSSLHERVRQAGELAARQ